MGCVAARLTHAGIPTVLAMTYSVLVITARQLFAKFYENLLAHRILPILTMPQQAAANIALWNCRGWEKKTPWHISRVY